jgi:hypothetical protein
MEQAGSVDLQATWTGPPARHRYDDGSRATQVPNVARRSMAYSRTRAARERGSQISAADIDRRVTTGVYTAVKRMQPTCPDLPSDPELVEPQSTQLR